MNDYVSPSVQKLADSYVDGQRFTTSSEVLLFSLDLLNAFEKHYQDRLGKEIQDGFSALDRGEGTVATTPEEIDQFFGAVMQGSQPANA
jgi:hypothetical protein